MTTYLSPHTAQEANPRLSTSSNRRSVDFDRGRKEDRTVVTSVPPPTSRPRTRDSSAHRHSRHISLDSLARFVHTLGHPGSGSHETVNPHFDLAEGPSAYTLYGELPGLDRDAVNIEVNDHHYTLTVSGVLWRPTPADVLAATPPNGASLTGGTLKASEAPAVQHMENVTEGKKLEIAPAAAPRGSEGLEPPRHEAAGSRRNSTASTVSPAAGHQDLHWHVTERRIGEFRRAFHFPFEGVDMHRVTATMVNGLLTVAVPKRALPEGVERKPRAGRRLEIAAVAGGETTTGIYPSVDGTLGAVV